MEWSEVVWSGAERSGAERRGEIEDEFDVEVEQTEAVNIRTVQEAVDYLEKLTAES